MIWERRANSETDRERGSKRDNGDSRDRGIKAAIQTDKKTSRPEGCCEAAVSTVSSSGGHSSHGSSLSGWCYLATRFCRPFDQSCGFLKRNRKDSKQSDKKTAPVQPKRKNKPALWFEGHQICRRYHAVLLGSAQYFKGCMKLCGCFLAVICVLLDLEIEVEQWEHRSEV